MSAYGLGRSVAPIDDALLIYGAEKEQNADLQSFFGRLLAYIPADIVTGYVAVAGFIPVGHANYTARWTIAFVFLALTPLVVVAGYAAARKSGSAVGSLPKFRLFASIFAYVAWVFALPASPFEELGDYASWLRPLILVVTTISLASFAPLLDQPGVD